MTLEEEFEQSTGKAVMIFQFGSYAYVKWLEKRVVKNRKSLERVTKLYEQERDNNQAFKTQEQPEPKEVKQCDWEWHHGMMRKRGYASCKKCGLRL